MAASFQIESDPIASAEIAAVEEKIVSFVGPDPPVDPPAVYIWVQTGLGDGTGQTIWIEDGA